MKKRTNPPQAQIRSNKLDAIGVCAHAHEAEAATNKEYNMRVKTGYIMISSPQVLAP